MVGRFLQQYAEQGSQQADANYNWQYYLSAREMLDVSFGYCGCLSSFGFALWFVLQQYCGHSSSRYTSNRLNPGHVTAGLIRSCVHSLGSGIDAEQRYVLHKDSSRL